MLRPFAALLLSIAVGMPSALARQAQVATVPAATDAAPDGALILRPSEPLELLFPQNTSTFARGANLRAGLSRSGGDASSRFLLTSLLQYAAGGSVFEKDGPLGAAVVDALLDAEWAAGLAPAADGKGAPAPLVAIRPRSAADTAKLVRRLTPKRPANGDAREAPPKVEKVAGFDVTPVAKSSHAFATDGRVVVLGPAAAVKEAVRNATGVRGTSLAGAQAFVDVEGQIGDDSDFLYFVLEPIESPWSSRRTAETETPAAKKENDRRRHAEALVGNSAVRAVGLSGQFRGDGLRLRAAAAVDRTKPTILGTLSDPPTVALDAAKYVPADADGLVVASLSLERICELFGARIDDEGRQALGRMPSWQEMEHYCDVNLGARLREDYFASLGTAVAVGFGGGSDDASEQGLGDVFAVIELRKPDAASRIFQRLFPASKLPVEHRGIALSPGPGTSVWAIVDGYALIGPADYVKRAIDAHLDGTSLAASAGYQATGQGVATSGVAAYYLAPNYLGLMLAKMDPDGAGRGPSPTTGIMLVVERSGLGLRATATVPSEVLAAFASSIGPYSRATAIAENESRAVGTLRTIGSAEATFLANNGRPAGLAELVKEKYVEPSVTDGAVLNGYRLTEVRLGTDADAWEFSVEPVDESAGRRSFNISGDYVIRYLMGATAPAGQGGTVLESFDRPIDLNRELLQRVESLWMAFQVLMRPLLSDLRTRNENFVISLLSEVNSLEAQAKREHGAVVPLDELGKGNSYAEGLLPTNGSIRMGYKFTEVSVDPTAGTYEVKAEPLDETTGTRAFTITEDGVVRFGPGLMAPPGKSGEPVHDARWARQQEDAERP